MQLIDNILKRVKGDRIMWMVILTLSLFSLLAVYSATGTLAFRHHDGNTSYYLLKQIIILVGGIVFIYVAHRVDYRYYSKLAQLLLIISIPLLIYTLVWGVDINDAKRWLRLPVIGLTFQTSDLAKLGLVMYLARLMSKRQENIKSFELAFLPVILPVAIVCVLIAPADLSTAMILFGTCILLMFIGRIHLGYISLTIVTGVALIGLLVAILMTVPQENLHGRMATWKKRIETHWSGATSGEQVVHDTYQVQQAKIAIANGGFLPNGPGNSTQKNFLPHPYSDFIYAIIIEEYGLIGGAFVLFLYLLFLFRCVKIVTKSPKAFGALLAFGLGLMLVIQAMVNMGVAVNLLPVTGMTLPLVSMGGSSVIFTCLALGIILSVSRNIEQQEEEEGGNGSGEYIGNTSVSLN